MDSPDRDDIRERASAGAVAFEDVVQKPLAFEPKPRTLLIVDRRVSESGRAWHLLGLLMLVGLVAVHLVRFGVGSLHGFGAMAASATVLSFATVLIVRGRPRKVQHEVPLLWLSSTLGLLRLRESPDQGNLSDSSNIAFEEVAELLFSRRSFQLPGARGAGRVEGAGVFVRLLDGAVWPVIPATLAQREAYNIALGVAQRIGVGVKQVGSGWTDGGQ